MVYAMWVDEDESQDAASLDSRERHMEGCVAQGRFVSFCVWNATRHTGWVTMSWRGFVGEIVALNKTEHLKGPIAAARV